MKAIFKKELRSYFYSPIGYVFVSIFFLVSSIFFTMYNLLMGYGDVNVVFGNMTMIFLFLTPILTMRSIAEEKNAKTDQLLLTSPVSVTSIVLGKLFAAVTVFLTAMALTLIYPLILWGYSEPAWGRIFGNYIGFILMGSAFVSIGIYISSLTENQIISAVATFGVLFFMWLAETFVSYTGIEFFQKVISWLSITSRFNDFTMGIINLQSVVYYLSIVAIFVFLTVSHIEKRRWKK